MSERYKFFDKESIYFVTPTIVGWVDLFTKQEYTNLVLDSLKYCQNNKGLVIHAWCIMSSHLHLIISSRGIELSSIMRDFKNHTSKKIVKELSNGVDSRKDWMIRIFEESAGKINRNKSFKIWQDGNHPILLDTNEMIEQRLEYLHMNPVEAGIVYNDHEYCYSSAIDYSGGKGLLDVELIY